LLLELQLYNPVFPVVSFYQPQTSRSLRFRKPVPANVIKFWWDHETCVGRHDSVR
jgi:hypothetical protein